MTISELRLDYHSRISSEIIRINRDKKSGIEYPNFADSGNASSMQFAWGIVQLLHCPRNYQVLTGQVTGGRFELATKDFLEKAFEHLQHIRPGDWVYSTKTPISGFEQYQHLAYLEKVIHKDKELASTLGGDYIVKPDIVIGRCPLSEEELNRNENLVQKDSSCAGLTPLRMVNHRQIHPLLHASISCKWTIRSDRSQNTRTEALNLIRNRKGSLPHIVSVTAEPLPTRIAALALGTGDMDCVYHFALNELRQTIEAQGNQDQLDMLMMLVEGKRLRDISDLPFDLAT
jgi:hypothetical protein